MSNHLLTVFRILPGIFIYLFTIFSAYCAIYNHQIFFYITGLWSVYLSFQASRIAIFGGIGYFKMKRNMNLDWHKEYEKKKSDLGNDTNTIRWEDTNHFLVVPNYKEHLSTLYEMLDRAKENTIAKTHVIVVLAMEQREQGSQEKANGLVQKYKKDFKDIIVSIHPGGIEGELPGKASNEQYATLQIEKYIEKNKEKIDMEKVVVSIADADSGYHKRYFEALNYNFIFNELRHSVVYQSVICNYKNYLSVPALTRLLGGIISCHEFASLNDPFDSHLPFSTYSFSFLFFKKIKGWDVDIIAEDWHLYLKSYFHTHGHAFVEPILLPTNVYNVESDTYWKSLTERYVQGVRHAWGIWECCYIYTRLWYTWRQLLTTPAKVIRTLNLLYKSFGVHLIAGFSVWMSVTPGIILAYNLFLLYFPPNIESKLRATIVINDYSWLFKMSSAYVIFPQSLVLLLNHFLYYLVTKKQLNTMEDKRKFVISFVYFALEFSILNPVAACFYAMIPTYVSSLRLMFTENFTYIVAPKPKTEEDIKREKSKGGLKETVVGNDVDNFDDEELSLDEGEDLENPPLVSDDKKVTEEKSDDSVKVEVKKELKKD